jgi:hypothetical protein
LWLCFADRDTDFENQRDFQDAINMTIFILIALIGGEPDPKILEENRLATRRVEERHDRMKARVGDLTRRKTVTVKKSKSKFRFGGGAGYNGFGGNGGYAGYDDVSGGAGGGIGAAFYNFGYGYANTGNARQEEHDETTEEFEMIYRDNNWYGGQLNLRNPYVTRHH